MFLVFTHGTERVLENMLIKSGSQKTVSAERSPMTNKVAVKIKNIKQNQILWEVFPRIEGHKHVITSATDVPFSGPETYMFAANEKGEIVDWCELPASYKGELDHKKCFEYIGYSTNE
jgi:hypothetical protein